MISKKITILIFVGVVLFVLGGYLFYFQDKSIKTLPYQEKNTVDINVGLAKNFLIQLQKDLQITGNIEETSNSVNFFVDREKLSGLTVKRTSLVNAPEKVLSIEDYLISKGMAFDIDNFGEATIKGQTAYKDGRLICIIYGSIPNSEAPAEQLLHQQTIFCAEHNDPPSRGESVLELTCNLQSCEISGVKPERADFYIQDSGKTVKVMIGGETRLRLKNTKNNNATIIKWSDFYPLITNPSNETRFNGGIYGDWIDSSTFKANWIIWPDYPRG